MCKILKDLYGGRIVPHEKSMASSPEYAKAVKELDKCETRLKENLDEQAVSMLDSYEKAYDAVNEACCTEAFIEGFRLGARLMLEVLGEKDGENG